MGTRFCGSCGSEVCGGKFCGSCGAPIPDAPMSNTGPGVAFILGIVFHSIAFVLFEISAIVIMWAFSVQSYEYLTYTASASNGINIIFQGFFLLLPVLVAVFAGVVTGIKKNYAAGITISLIFMVLSAVCGALSMTVSLNAFTAGIEIIYNYIITGYAYFTGAIMAAILYIPGIILLSIAALKDKKNRA